MLRAWCFISEASSCFCTSAEAYALERHVPIILVNGIEKEVMPYHFLSVLDSILCQCQQTCPEHSFILPRAEPRSRKYINVLHPKAVNQGLGLLAARSARSASTSFSLIGLTGYHWSYCSNHGDSKLGPFLGAKLMSSTSGQTLKGLKPRRTVQSARRFRFKICF